MIQAPRFRTNANCVAHMSEVDAAISDWFETKSRSEALATMYAADVTVGPVYDIADTFADAHFRERRVFVEVEDDELGTVTMQNITPAAVFQDARGMALPGPRNWSVYRRNPDRSGTGSRTDRSSASGRSGEIMRSLLDVPANSERFVAKSADIGADVIILDLEDGVGEAQKDNARRTLTEAVQICASGSLQIFLRINGGTERERADVEAVFRAGAHGVFLPKARNAHHIRQLVETLESHEAQSLCVAPLKLIVAIETADALFKARDIARASDKIVGLNCGSEDIATALGASRLRRRSIFQK